MKHTTRAIVGIASVIVSALTLSACSGSGSPAPTPSSTDPVEITFSSWLRGSQEVVDAFNAAQDDIIVSFEQVASSTDNYPALVNQTQAGTAPDVVTVEYPFVAEMATQGVLLDVTDLAGDFVADNYEESIRDLVTFGGSTWALPYDAGVVQLFYRSDLFEQYGIDVPTTWDEYEQAAKDMVAANPEARIGATIVNSPPHYAALAWQNGAQWASVDEDSWSIDIDDDATIEMADFHQSLVDQGLVWTDDAEVLSQKQSAGTLLSVISGSWYGGALQSAVADQAGKWRVAQLPSWTAEPTTGMFGGSTFGVSAGSEKAEAALTFIKWMTTTAEGVTPRVAAGGSTAFPVNPEARAAAEEAFDPTFFGGQDLYGVVEAGYESIPAGWVWGPANTTTFSSLLDASAAVWKGDAKLANVFPIAQQDTVDAMDARGISVD